MVLVDYNFKNMHFEKQATKLYKYTNHDYGIRYKNISNVEIDDCISYIRDNDIYVLGRDIGDCYVTRNHPIDSCICRFNKDNNVCCGNGLLLYNSIFEIYLVIIVFTFPFVFKLIKINQSHINYDQLPTIVDDVIVLETQTPNRYETHKIYNEDNCVICDKQYENVILYPCCHKCICMECANQLEQRKCPYCNIQFTDILTT
jgi:hypothetical protein